MRLLVTCVQEGNLRKTGHKHDTESLFPGTKKIEESEEAIEAFIYVREPHE